MTNCKHSFIGKADGVHCAKCGLKLTAQEYAAMAQPAAAEAKIAPESQFSRTSVRLSVAAFHRLYCQTVWQCAVPDLNRLPQYVNVFRQRQTDAQCVTVLLQLLQILIPKCFRHNDSLL